MFGIGIEFSVGSTSESGDYDCDPIIRINVKNDYYIQLFVFLEQARILRSGEECIT